MYLEVRLHVSEWERIGGKYRELTCDQGSNRCRPCKLVIRVGVGRLGGLLATF